MTNSNINAEVRLRPIRFAFIVRPNDRRRLTEIFTVNTCLWGGRFNPIIPYFKQVPKWWDRHGIRFANSKQIINGYLDFFEPDFLVEAEPGIAANLGFENDRILSLDSLLIKAGDKQRKGYGLSVIDIYNHLYDTDYKFIHRTPHDLVDIRADDSSLECFAACTFGSFPTSAGLTYFHRVYKGAFDPKEIALSADTYVELLQSGFTSPLKISRHGLDINFHTFDDPTLFIMDATEPHDLIDFWNLGTFTNHVIPIPVQWIGALSDWCKSFISAAHQAVPGNPNNVMNNAVSMFSRSIPKDSIQKLYTDHLHVGIQGADVIQDWYPSIWLPDSSFSIRTQRATLSAKEQSSNHSINIESPFVAFDSLHPEFAEKYANDIRWANVINLKEWSISNSIATCFPTDYKSPKYPSFRTATDKVLPTTEGLVAFPRYVNQGFHFSLSNGVTAVSDWLKTFNIEAAPSDAGRITQQVIQTIGGLNFLSNIAHKDIIELLNSISNGPPSRTMKDQELRSRIDNIVKKDHFRNHTFWSLVKQGVFELGLEVRCQKCSSWSWHPVNRLDYNLTCTLCNQSFQFPITDPGLRSKSRWAYRITGPFALPDYASGGYASALSIRFFTDVFFHSLDSDITWSPGLTLKFGKEDEAEADFILWQQSTHFMRNGSRTELIFGESKSFGNRRNHKQDINADTFSAEDIARLKSLALKFPGSTLVFSTMKQSNELTASEISKLKGIANWGRSYIKERRHTRAPVIILTGTELFSSFRLETTWTEIGGRHAELARHSFYGHNKLKQLADFTQQLYLNMPSYSDWIQERFKKKQAKRDNR